MHLEAKDCQGSRRLGERHGRDSPIPDPFLFLSRAKVIPDPALLGINLEFYPFCGRYDQTLSAQVCVPNAQ